MINLKTPTVPVVNFGGSGGSNKNVKIYDEMPSAVNHNGDVALFLGESTEEYEFGCFYRSDGTQWESIGKRLSANDYTALEKNKLSGIETGAEVNKIETIKVDGTVLTPANKIVDIDLRDKENVSNKKDRSLLTSYTDSDKANFYASLKCLQDHFARKVIDSKEAGSLNIFDFGAYRVINTNVDTPLINGVHPPGVLITLPWYMDFWGSISKNPNNVEYTTQLFFAVGNTAFDTNKNIWQRYYYGDLAPNPNHWSDWKLVGGVTPKSSYSTESGAVYNVTYINDILGDVEAALEELRGGF